MMYLYYIHITYTQDDILTQIVAIEYLRYLADTNAGLTYLFTSSEGIFAWLVTVAHGSFANSDTDSYTGSTRGAVSYDPVLVSQCLREVSEIFHRASKNHLLDDATWNMLVGQDYLQKFLHATLSHIDGVTEETRLTGLKVITDFATASPNTLALIVNDKHLLTSWCAIINGSKVDLQATALHSYARVIEHDYHTNKSAAAVSTTPSNVSVDSLKMRLWQSIGETKRAPSTLSYLLRLAHQPVSNLRHAGLDVLQSILKYDLTSSLPNNSQGLQLLCMNAEFRTYLTDQETEGTKEGREWKFALIQAVVRHPMLETLSGLATLSSAATGSDAGDWVSELRRVESRGPFYKPSQMSEMATMEH